MPVKVLLVSEFDPAGVLTGWKRALRALNVDCRLVVNEVAQIPVEPDWITSASYSASYLAGEEYRDLEALRAFAGEADVAVWNPAIGQPWSYMSDQVVLRDGPDHPLHAWISAALRKTCRHVTVIHGSRNAQLNAEVYADHWSGRGHEIWATTLDYAHRLGADYAPPSVVVPEPGCAKPRGDDDPLVVAHAPTDPGNCHTDVFLRACAATGAVADFIYGVPHAEVLRRKSRCHAGFDHLRGSFSVNTVECVALGLAPLVGLRPEYKPLLYEAVGAPLADHFSFDDGLGFVRDLRSMSDDPGLTRAMQMSAHEWYLRCWNRDAIGLRLMKLVEDL